MKIPFNKIVEISYALLDKNSHPRYRHFSFILDGSKIVSIGLNQQKTHPITRKYKYWTERVHSELKSVIRLGIEDASGLTLVNTRITRGDEKLGNSKPCVGCANMIKQLNFDQVWYTNENGSFEQFV